MRNPWALALAACLFLAAPIQALAREVAVPPDDVANAPADTLGTVIGTIGLRGGFKEARPSWARLIFRRVGSTKEGTLRVDRSEFAHRGSDDDLIEGDFQYAAFRMDLPEGQYEIIRVIGDYDVQPMIGCIGCNIQSANPVDFSVPFVVERGKVLYLGSFLAHGTLDLLKLGFIPMPYPSIVYFSWFDKWPRDQALFAAAGKLATDTTDVRHATLAVNRNTGFFIFAEDHVAEPKVKMKDVKSGSASFEGKITRFLALHPEEGPAPPPITVRLDHPNR
jgi:hypothetical protein